MDGYAWNGWHYFTYKLMWQSETSITQDARPKIINIPLTLILRLLQGACHFCLCLFELPIPQLWMSATNYHLDYPRCNAKYCWYYIDSYSLHRAVTVTVSPMPIMVSNTLVVPNSDQIASQYPCLQDIRSIMVHLHSFWCVVHSHSASIDNWIQNYNKLLVAFLTDWYLALWQCWAQ